MGLFRKKQPYVPQGRIGLYEVVAEGHGRYAGITFEATLRVEELKTEGSYSVCKLLNIYGQSDWRIQEGVRRAFVPYIPTDEIEWLDGN